MELNTARIFVADLAEARPFYETALALPLKIDGESHGFLVFRSGGMDLLVEAVPVDAPQDEQVLVGRFTGLSFAVPDIHSKDTELLGKGVSFSGAPEPQAWGGTLATFVDPAGNGRRSRSDDGRCRRLCEECESHGNAHAIAPPIAASIEISRPPQRREDTPIKLVFGIRSLAAARAAAKALGGELDPEEKVWEFQGSRVCDGHDPEGNVIQVREHAVR